LEYVASTSLLPSFLERHPPLPFPPYWNKAIKLKETMEPDFPFFFLKNRPDLLIYALNFVSNIHSNSPRYYTFKVILESEPQRRIWHSYLLIDVSLKGTYMRF
jgi:hypothetical protein